MRTAFVPTIHKIHWILKGFSVKIQYYKFTFYERNLSGFVVCANDTERQTDSTNDGRCSGTDFADTWPISNVWFKCFKSGLFWPIYRLNCVYRLCGGMFYASAISSTIYVVAPSFCHSPSSLVELCAVDQNSKANICVNILKRVEFFFFLNRDFSSYNIQ